MPKKVIVFHFQPCYTAEGLPAHFCPHMYIYLPHLLDRRFLSKRLEES
jgi:hypothetical protein